MRRNIRQISILVLTILAAFLWFAGMLASPGNADIEQESVVGVWLFDQGKGDTVRDSSKNGHDGKVQGNVKWAEGKFRNALEFPGVAGSFVNIPDQEGLNLVTWSIVVWLKMDRVNGSEVHVVIKEEPGDTRNYGIIVEPGFAYPTFTAGKAVWRNVAGKTPVADGEWHHVAATYDKILEKLYVDGSSDVQVGFADIPDVNPGPLGIGAGGVNGTVGPVIGVIDEVAVFSVALEEEDIADIMKNGLEAALGISAVSPPGKLSAAWGMVKRQASGF